MNGNKILGLVILAVGVVLIYFGWQGSESISDQVSEAVTGRFTDETMIYIVGGIVAAIIGGFLLTRK